MTGAVSQRQYFGHKLLQGAPYAGILFASPCVSVPCTVGALACLYQKPSLLSERAWSLTWPYLANGVAIAASVKACELLFAGSWGAGLGCLGVASLASGIADRLVYPEVEPNGKQIVFAGSFNPPTLGHVYLLEALSEKYDEVHAVVGSNPSKTYTVSAERRLGLLKQIIGDNPKLSRVCAAAHSGFVFDYANKHGIGNVGRGVRDSKDWWDERFLQALNFMSAPHIDTVLLPTIDKVNEISSSLVRSKMEAGQDIKGLVPESARLEIEAAYAD